MAQQQTSESGKGLLDRISNLGQAFCALLLVVMTVIISWQIFGRFVLNDTPKWSEQLAGVLMVYLTMIGGALAVRQGSHIALEYFRDHFSPFWQRATRRLILLLMMMFGAIMVVYGIQMARLVHEWIIPTLNLSQGANYWAFPVSGALIVVFAIELWRNGDNHPGGDAAGPGRAAAGENP